jgi:hypothetical protein
MELLGNMGHVESRIVPFGDGVSVKSCGKIGAWFAPNIPQAQKSFWMHPMVLLRDEPQVEGRFGPFRDSANLDTR